MWVIFKQPQDNAPHQRGKQWEWVAFRLGDKSFLDRQPRQSEQDPGQQVHVDLQKSRMGRTLLLEPSQPYNDATAGRSYLTIDVVVISKH